MRAAPGAANGLPNGAELRIYTTPAAGDTHGTGGADGADDSDGDGFSNADEIAAGTDPANGADDPTVRSLPSDPDATPAAPFSVALLRPAPCRAHVRAQRSMSRC